MNPIWWVYLRINGDARQPLLLGLGYLVVVGVCFAASWRMSSDHRNLMAIWLALISGGQAVFLLLAAPSSITRAVRRDYECGMIESLRQTPMSNAGLAIGLLFGPMLTLLCLFSAGLLAGGFFASGTASTTGMNIQVSAAGFIGAWWFFQALLLLFGVFISSIALLAAVHAAGSKFNLLGVLLVIGLLGGWGAIYVLPGLALIVSLFNLPSVMSTMAGGAVSMSPKVYGLGGLFQIGLTVVFVAAAAAKIRRPEGPVIPLKWSLLLLVLWCAASIAGFSLDPTGTVRMGAPQDDVTPVWIGATIVATLVLGLFAIQGAALAAVAADRAAPYASPQAGLDSWVGPGAVAFAVFAAAAGMSIVDPRDGVFELILNAPVEFALAGVAVLLSIWLDYSMLYRTHARQRKLWLALLIWWGAYRIGLMVFDGMVAMIAAMSGDFDGPELGLGFSAASPIGTLIAAFLSGTANASPSIFVMSLGIMVQAFIAVFMHVLARKARSKTAAPPRE